MMGVVSNDYSAFAVIAHEHSHDTVELVVAELPVHTGSVHRGWDVARVSFPGC